MLLDENKSQIMPSASIEAIPGAQNHQGHSNHPDHPDHPDHPSHPDHPTPPEKPITLIVNGVEKTLPLGIHELSYEDVVRLAYGSYSDNTQTIYTVVYSNGPAENRKGSLVKGRSVMIWEGMIFNVGRSDKS